jgi:hypothetical protein
LRRPASTSGKRGAALSAVPALKSQSSGSQSVASMMRWAGKPSPPAVVITTSLNLPCRHFSIGDVGCEKPPERTTAFVDVRCRTFRSAMFEHLHSSGGHKRGRQSNPPAWGVAPGTRFRRNIFTGRVGAMAPHGWVGTVAADNLWAQEQPVQGPGMCGRTEAAPTGVHTIRLWGAHRGGRRGVLLRLSVGVGARDCARYCKA